MNPAPFFLELLRHLGQAYFFQFLVWAVTLITSFKMAVCAVWFSFRIFLYLCYLSYSLQNSFSQSLMSFWLFCPFN